MSLKRKIHTFFHTPRIVMKKFAATRIFRHLPDELALKIIYKNTFLKELNLKDPKTFNEKLQWLKLYNRKPEYSAMVDKYEAKKIAKRILGSEHIIPSYGVWKKFEDINFSQLPEQFVLKCTHGSGDVVIVKDKSKMDMEEARRKINRSLNTNYYLISREWPYKNVEPRIIAEKYMEDQTGELKDYKVYCFNGVAKIMMISSNRFSKEQTCYDFVDRDRNWMMLTRGNPRSTKKPKLPEQFETMMNYAEEFSKGLPHLRVDFYEVNGKLYFGELTFFPGGGFVANEPEEWDEKMGDWIDISMLDNHNKENLKKKKGKKE